MTARPTLARAILLAGLWLTAAAARAQDPGVSASVAESTAPATEAHARIDLSHTVTADDVTTRHLSFTDLRVTADAVRRGDMQLSARLDARLRKASDAYTADRFTPTELYARLGAETDTWRLTAGRQIMRQFGSAEVDGVAVERRLTETLNAVAFGGLQAHPLTGDFNVDFATAGVGVDQRSATTNHAAGAILSLHLGSLDRLYLVDRLILNLSREWLVVSDVIADVFAPKGLLPLSPEGSGGPSLDLTSFNGLVRWRPIPLYTASLSLSHQHTLLPNRWWADWLNEQRKARGIVLDGEEPVGTRITSVRFTNTLNLGPAYAPYLRLRYDRRHTEQADGGEAMIGFKWRPAFGYADVHYAYRRFFQTQGHLAEAQVGVEQPVWGTEVGAGVSRVTPFAVGAVEHQTLDAHAVAWLDLWGSLKGARLTGLYQGFFEPTATMHVGMAMVGYRF